MKVLYESQISTRNFRIILKGTSMTNLNLNNIKLFLESFTNVFDDNCEEFETVVIFLVKDYRANASIEILSKSLEVSFNLDYIERNLLSGNLLSVFQILKHEYIHYLDRVQVKNSKKVISRFKKLFGFSKNVFVPEYMKKMQNLRVNFDLYDLENFQDYLSYLVYKLRNEGIATYFSGGLYKENFNSSSELNLAILSLFTLKLTNIKKTSIYFFGRQMTELISYYYLFELKKENYYIPKFAEKHNLKFKIMQNHNDLNANFIKLTQIDEKEIFNLIKNLSIKRFIKEYDKACDFFNIEPKDRIFTNLTFKFLLKEVKKLDSL